MPDHLVREMGIWPALRRAEDDLGAAPDGPLQGGRQPRPVTGRCVEPGLSSGAGEVGRRAGSTRQEDSSVHVGVGGRGPGDWGGEAWE